jgi:hypothetical protein
VDGVGSGPAGEGSGPAGEGSGPAGVINGPARDASDQVRDASGPARIASDPRPEWEILARLVRKQAPHLSMPPPVGRGVCAVCRGPAGRGNARCYPCGLHAETLPGLLADVVVPISYAAKRGEHARNLWMYKSARQGADPARAALRALLVVFLRDHGRCVWRAAGMTRPTHFAVVPSGRGRAGPHPLHALVAPCIALPWASLDLRLRDDPGIRDLDADRFLAAPLAGAAVALLDDTWTTGASAQSASAALRLAGARSVAVIVLGRHLGGPDRGANAPDPGGRVPAALPFLPWLCAVHARSAETGQ